MDTSEVIVVGQPVGIPITSAVAGTCGPVQITTAATGPDGVNRVWGHARSVGAAAEPAIVDLCLE